MKSATLARPEDKTTVRSALPSSNIFTAAVVRLYVCFFGEDQWRYSGLWGAMAFCKDRDRNNSCFMRLVDMENHRGVVWEQELYHGFEYVKDCPFLHTFVTDDYLAGLLFVHQGEADAFYQKVIDRDSIKLKQNRKSDIGKVRYTPGKGFTVDNNDPEILEILRELEKMDDFSAADIDRNQEFIQEFIRQYRASNKKASSSRRMPPPPPPPSRNQRARAPPPPIPSIKNPLQGKSSPPPPLPGRGIKQLSSSANNNISKSLPPPPPPPPPPRAMPTNTGGMAPSPPPPPPPPPSSVPSVAAASPIPATVDSDGQSNLMAAIRSTGGFGTLRKSGSLKPAQHNAISTNRTHLQSSAPEKGNMQSSLAAALQQRKTALQSDNSDNDSDDDDDWK